MKRLCLMILCLVGGMMSFADRNVPKVNKIMPYTKGLNLSSWLEPFGSGNSCSTQFDKTDFEDIKSLGVEVLRVPVHFETWSKGAPDYIVEDWLWKCLDNAVDWCEELHIQGNVLKVIRSIDSKHTVIVGAENWNSLEAMLQLPDYNDDNLIYNFHDYSPFLFTHQGASWTDISKLKNIPFPYVKEKMPPLPKNATDNERNYYRDYLRASSEEVLCEPLNRAVEFANKRNVALMCNEYGVLMDYADNQERTNLYRMKAKWMEERGIIRVSWDYKGGFGIFNTPNGSFPEDTNDVLLKGMGFNPPSKNSASGML